MEIVYKIKNIFGIEKRYPISSDAKFIAAIAGTKTLTDKTLQVIREMRPNAIIADELTFSYLANDPLYRLVSADD